ncbi:Predicted arabinose efflux permease, MFS family [Clostridium sp. DSM 8431]|uniref:MDR family MFS transporter n=1 Tax=Clostridium sp. DSM 8431 TaxID=1761781 RepID=UPI0008E27D45|nr:MFS transporter [Clostridium sp. DSM 8431]SFU37369.1 Predicted arabinose efflux permease, MFS family [Clostridium sp. DSM 8431]
MRNTINIYKGLTKPVYILCFATLINRLGDFVIPFLTLFLTKKLNMSIVMSGMLVTCASLISIPASIIGGKLADYIGRKKVYLYGQGLSGVLLILCAFSTNKYLTIALIFISTFFNGFVRPVFGALIIDYLPKEKRQSGISLNYLCMNVGASIGPVIAGLLFNKYLPLFFIGDGITSLLAVVLVFKNINGKDTYEVNEEEASDINEKAKEGNIIELLFKKPELLSFFILFLVYQFVYSQHKFMLPLTVNNALADTGSAVFGDMMSINALTVVVFTIFITSLIKKYHTLTSMALSGVCFAFGYGMLAFVDSTLGFFLSTFIWSIGEIICTISVGVFVADNSPANFRGRISAVQNIVYWAGTSLSTLVGGVLVENFDFPYIWIAIFVIAMIASFLMYLLKIFCVKQDKLLKVEAASQVE